jgi:hypothetical protein
MTAVVEPVGERYDVRTIVGSGVKLGVITALAVAVFALASRALAGTAETAVQFLLVFVGGALASYLPAVWVRPRSADAIAWAALVGLLGALVFTVLDTVLLRPLGFYHWTWDAIGGGSGFWYVPVWWMGAAVLAWLGSWIAALGFGARAAPNILAASGVTAVLAVVVFAILAVTRLAPVHPAVLALAWAIALVLHVPLAAVLVRR